MGAWNEPTFSAREWRSAAARTLGANGSCTCTKSRATPSSSSSIVRATSTGSEAGRRAERKGSTSPDAEHARAAVAASSLAGRATRAPRDVAHEVERVRGCDDRDLVPALREPLRGLAHEGVDLVAVLPGVRRDLRDAESGHRPEG